MGASERVRERSCTEEEGPRKLDIIAGACLGLIRHGGER